MASGGGGLVSERHAPRLLELEGNEGGRARVDILEDIDRLS